MSALVESEVLLQANALKDEGNVLLSNGKYNLAADKYTQAIEVVPTAIFYSNRAQALIKLESYGLAISDANEALK
jgi:serine/threonine-protein phosphatase 5